MAQYLFPLPLLQYFVTKQYYFLLQWYLCPFISCYFLITMVFIFCYQLVIFSYHHGIYILLLWYLLPVTMIVLLYSGLFLLMLNTYTYTRMSSNCDSTIHQLHFTVLSMKIMYGVYFLSLLPFLQIAFSARTTLTLRCRTTIRLWRLTRMTSLQRREYRSSTTSME